MSEIWKSLQIFRGNVDLQRELDLSKLFKCFIQVQVCEIVCGPHTLTTFEQIRFVHVNTAALWGSLVVWIYIA